MKNLKKTFQRKPLLHWVFLAIAAGLALYYGYYILAATFKVLHRMHM